MSNIIQRVYHGSPKKFDVFDLAKTSAKSSHSSFFTSNFNIARGYAGSKGIVYIVNLTMTNPLVVDAEGANWNRIDYERNSTYWIVEDETGESLETFTNEEDADFFVATHDNKNLVIIKDYDESTIYSTNDISALAKHEGYDGAIIEDVIDSNKANVRESSTVYTVFNPEQIEVVEAQLMTLTECDSTIMNFLGNMRDFDPPLVESLTTFFESITEDHDYRMDHTAPDKSDSPLHDISETFPDDIMGPRGALYYGDGDVIIDKECVRFIKFYKNKPTAKIKIYRAVPDFKKINNNSEKEPQPQSKINPGDWVTISKQYAINHGERQFDDGYKILEKVVTASEVYTDGNSVAEWGYNP